MQGMFDLGMDVGSVSINLVVLSPEGQVLREEYRRHHGEPYRLALELLKSLEPEFPKDRCRLAAFTGLGGKVLAELLGGVFVNEVIAQARGAYHFHPEARSIIDMGGEDAKLLLVADENGHQVIQDFAMNTMCAAGTGSFLDQQAHRLGFTIEQFSENALKSTTPPRIAGRCSVFAKTDMIHLQQGATPDFEIIAGLCQAVARNLRSNIAKGKTITPPVVFQGGVAHNLGVRQAFRQVFKLEEDGLIIPPHFCALGALGAALTAREQAPGEFTLNLQPLTDHLARDAEPCRSLAALTPPPRLGAEAYAVAPLPPFGSEVESYLGVDVGSISTNVVVIDREMRVLAREYLLTAGRPLEAITEGLKRVGGKLAGRVRIMGAATTGSGRYLTGDFIGADVVRNEITAQATAAAAIDPTVDTIFEIGGQDSKFISLEHGAIVDFMMNKVCAAGTGSFLEEQAEKLGISIKEEFANLAFQSQAPANLGERCTVFMETELVRHQQHGVPKEDLVAGLAYSIVYNYLNRVVAGKRVGEHIFFQGGVAFNRSVAEAFARVTGKPIIVPEHHEVTGAIGCALLAMENDRGQGSRFKGFDLSTRSYTIESFECEDCPNRCEINKVTVEGEQPRHYGSRCGKWEEEEEKARKKSDLPDLFAEREKLLLKSYHTPSGEQPKNRPKVGLPRMLLFYELFPLWKAFFEELGFEVVLSERTNKRVIHRGCEAAVAETCFPIKLGIGHVTGLVQKEIDYLFLPSVINLPRRDESLTDSFVCPYIQSFPYTVKSSVDLTKNGVKLLQPAIHLERGEKQLIKVMARVARQLGVERPRLRTAVKAGLQAQAAFQEALRRRGEEVLASLPPDKKTLVIVARSYNGCDSGANLEIPRKLREMGVLPIPMDLLPVDAAPLQGDWSNMYWRYGQKILAAAEIIANDPRLHSVYITNFGCGPDSFLTRFFRKRMGKKPYLLIEIDEHSADAGIITRIEAFLDSLEGAQGRDIEPAQPYRIVTITRGEKRIVMIPHMADHAFALAAAFAASGMPAEVLPEPDEETLFWGRKYTSGKECFPAIVTTGDMVKFTKSPKFDRKKYAFFMGGSGGPCRFGQYNRLHRLILDELGLPQVPILVFDQTGGYHKDMAALGRNFRLHAWRGIAILDSMQKMLLEKRPYEVNEGETDAAYKEQLDLLIKNIGRDSDTLKDFSRRAKGALKSVKADKNGGKPRIGIVGEIFVRSNRFANDSLIRRLEALGAQCGVPPLEEWLDYIDHQRKRRNRLHLEGGWRDWAKQKLTEIVQEKVAEPIRREFDSSIAAFGRELPTQAILDKGHTYLTPAVEGEAILSMGRVVEYAEHGYDGIVNILPFGCMPGTIVSLLLHQFRRDYGLPVLNVVVEGTKDPGRDVRFEAFLQQCKEHLREGKSTKHDTSTKH